MRLKKPKNDVKEFEQALKDSKEQKYLLRLYVTGATPKSTEAIVNIKKFCEEHLKGRYDLEVIDIYQQPMLAKGDQIIAAPTLVKKLPPPLRKFIGSMADLERILIGLDVKAMEKIEPEKSPSKKKGSEAR